MSNERVNGESLILSLPIHKVRAFSDQPRKFFSPQSLQGLADSIRELGQISPGIVRKLEQTVGEFEYELVDGERRIRACLMAGKNHFRAEVETGIKNGDEQFERSVAANFNRDGHPPIEIARAIERLKKMGRTDKQIGIIMGGKSSSWIYQHHSLIKLPDKVLKYMDPSLPDEERLATSIAFTLANDQIPTEYKIGLADTIVGAHLNNKEASNLIQKTMFEKTGVSIGRRDKEWVKIQGFIRRTQTHLKLLNDTDDNHLNLILKAKELQVRMELVGELEKLQKETSDLHAKIMRILEQG